MSNLSLAIGIAASLLTGQQGSSENQVQVDSKPIQVQFVKSLTGHNVTVSIDGKKPRMTFAGKLGFTDGNRTWQSVCADVRSPIAESQRFIVKPGDSKAAGGNLALAGNIVAKYFNAAKTPDQCAALQLAVWEAVEDGGPHANFAAGRFRAQSGGNVLDMASDLYESLFEAGQAALLTSQEGGQSQLSSRN